MLDSALCSKIHRGSLMNTWKEDEYKFSDSTVPLSDSLVTWMTKRGVKVVSVVLSDRDVESSLCREFFEDNHNSIRSVTYHGAPSATSKSLAGRIERLVSSCPNLLELTLHNVDMNDFNLRRVLVICSKLVDLRLPFCSSVDLKAIHECGLRIRSLDLSGLKSTREPAQEADALSFSPTNSLHKLIIFNLPRRLNRLLLTSFICANAGLRELQIDQLCGSEICTIVRHCPLLTTLRADMRFDEEVGIDVEEFRAFAGGMRNMRHLQLSERTSDVHFMSDELLLVLLQCCPELVAFVGYDVGDEAWSDIIRCDLPRLKNAESFVSTHITPSCSALRILYMKSIRVATLWQLLSICPHLHKLGMMRFADFDATLRVLHGSTVSKMLLHVPFGCKYNTIHLLTGLTSLTLIRCVGFTDAHLAVIARNNPLLSTLRLTQCDSVSDAALASSLSSLSKLRTCEVERSHLKPQGVDKLMEEDCICTMTSIFDMDVEVM